MCRQRRLCWGGGGLCPGLRELRNKVEEEGEGGR